MSRRWADSTRSLILSFLIERDGPLCFICGADPSTPLEIDHIDPDSPAHAKNLRQLCKSCNLARRRPPGDRGIVSVGVDNSCRQLSLDDAPVQSPTTTAKKALAYSDGSPEMQASGYFEPNYRAWVTEQIPLSKNDAIYGGAEAVGCSTETATRYLAKMTSIAGPLTTAQDSHGLLTIQQKEQKK